MRVENGTLLACASVFFNSSVLKKFNDRYTAMTLSNDGSIMAAGNEKGAINVWDTKNMDKSESYNITEKQIYAIEFSPDDRTVAVGDEAGVVQLGDVVGQDIFFTRAISNQKSRINKIKFSPDGKLLATASLDGSVQMWVTENLDKMLPVAFKDHKDYVWSITFNKTSDYLLAGTKDGVLKLWPTRPDLMAGDICRYLFRNLTKTEWDRYVGEDIRYINTCERAGVVPTK